MNQADLIIFKNRADSVRKSKFDTAQHNLNVFITYVNDNLELSATYKIITGNGLPNFKEWEQKIIQSRKLQFPDDYLEKIKVCLSFLEAVRNGEIRPSDIAGHFSGYTNLDDLTGEFISEYFEPVFTYFQETLIRVNDFLYTLIRFKIFTEWFKQKEYYSGYISDTSHGENFLDGKLREFLFISGTDYPFSTPLSPDGRTDILQVINGKPIPIEIKVYGGDMNHIRQGFRQAILYANDYNASNGYLVIYNVTNKEVSFPVNFNESINHNGKNIYVIIINLYPHSAAASKRQMETVELTIEYLKS